MNIFYENEKSENGPSDLLSSLKICTRLTFNSTLINKSSLRLSAGRAFRSKQFVNPRMRFQRSTRKTRQNEGGGEKEKKAEYTFPRSTCQSHFSKALAFLRAFSLGVRYARRV